MYQSRAKQGGVCILTHGAVVKRCNYEGCTRQAQKGGVCVTHGAVENRCYHEGCTKYAVKGGVCLHMARSNFNYVNDAVIRDVANTSLAEGFVLHMVL
jgi:hypothetical protein